MRENKLFKYFTVAELIDAIEQNGYRQIRSNLFSPNGACAWGQMLLNLGIKDIEPTSKAKWVSVDTMYTQTYRMNDLDTYTPRMIANILRKRYVHALDYELRGRKVDYKKHLAYTPAKIEEPVV